MSQNFLFLILILKYIKSESCSKSDCLSCNSLSSCKYENGLCLSDDTKDSKINFFKKLKSCKSDLSSLSLMANYCGILDYTFQGKEIKIQMNKVNNQYGISNLFCLYTITNENYSKKDFYITTKRDDFSFDLYMEVMSSTKLYEMNDKKMIYTIPKKYEGIYIMYYNKLPSDKLPFEVIISKNLNNNYTIIIVCSILMIIVAILLIILIILYKKKEHQYEGQFNRRRRFREREREEEKTLNEVNKNIAKEFSNKLVSTVFNLVQDSSKNSVCTFCLNEFKMDDVVYMGNCKHVFHFNEIKKWFYSENSFNNTCPECRNEFIQFYRKGDNLNQPLSSQNPINTDKNNENNSENNNVNNNNNNNNNDNIPNLADNDSNENDIENPNVITIQSNYNNTYTNTLRVRDNED